MIDPVLSVIHDVYLQALFWLVFVSILYLSTHPGAKVTVRVDEMAGVWTRHLHDTPGLDGSGFRIHFVINLSVCPYSPYCLRLELLISRER